jgi:glutamine phosphoribosylpyrophosphate amidotransferase
MRSGSTLNADSLAYLSKEGMVKATGLPKEAFLHGLLRRQLSGAV